MKIRSKILVPFLLIFSCGSVVGSAFFIHGLTSILEQGQEVQLQSQALRVGEHLARQEERVISHARCLAEMQGAEGLAGMSRAEVLQSMEVEHVRVVGYADRSFPPDDNLFPLVRLGLKGVTGSQFVEMTGPAGEGYFRLVGVAPVPAEVEIREVLLVETRLDAEYLRRIGLSADTELILFNSQGRPVVGSRIASEVAGWMRQQGLDMFAAAVQREDGLGSLQRLDLGGEQYHLVTAPLPEDYRVAGSVALIKSTKPFERKRQRLIAKAALFAGGILCLLSMVYLLVVRTITRPLNALEAAAEAMMRGDEIEPLNFTGRDEIGTLARTFDQMAEILRRRQEELRKTVDEYRYQGEQMRLIMENMADGVVVINGDYRVEYMNRAAEKIYGKQVGQICYRTFRNTSQPCSPCSVEEIIKKGGSSYHYTARGAGGRYYEVVGRPLRDRDGKIKVLSLRRDITERVTRFEEQRKAQQNLQAERLKAIRQVGVSIKHGINNALAAISCSLQYLREEEAMPFDKQATMLGMMAQEVVKIQEIVAKIEDITEAVEVNYTDEVTMIDLDASGKKGPEPDL